MLHHNVPLTNKRYCLLSTPPRLSGEFFRSDWRTISPVLQSRRVWNTLARFRSRSLVLLGGSLFRCPNRDHSCLDLIKLC